MIVHALRSIYLKRTGMSFIQSEDQGAFVACDICKNYSALFDPDWRRMRNDANGQPQHLCRECRKSAVWCETHYAYHLAEANHRRACADCGGLFTAQVQLNLEHCPSCRRSQSLAPRQVARPTLWKYLQTHLFAYLV
jgi:hypothetical protein